MANKRLIFDVPEELHSRLKSEAAQLGVSLGLHCASILEGGESSSLSFENLDSATLSVLPVGTLREFCSELIEKRPNGWQQKIRSVNFELQRRYKIR